MIRYSSAAIRGTRLSCGLRYPKRHDFWALSGLARRVLHLQGNNGWPLGPTIVLFQLYLYHDTIDAVRGVVNIYPAALRSHWILWAVGFFRLLPLSQLVCANCDMAYHIQFSPVVFHALIVVCFLSLALNVYTYFPRKKTSLQLLPTTSDEDVPIEVTKESEDAAASLTSESTYQLERRAIFSKSWLCVSHRSRFGKAGDYVAYEVAGYPFFLILGKDSVLRAFHNVCRHRAYGITRKAAGSSLVMGCKYHGWTYDTKGQLRKAPQFEGVPGFDKTQNGLFEIHCRVDAHGLVYVNLDASEKGRDLPLPNIWRCGRLSQIKKNSCWLHCFELKGNFNWKVACEYNPALRAVPRGTDTYKSAT